MLARFNVLNSENDQTLDGIDYPILLNTDHIASIKSINIMHKGNIIKGFWIRMTSGKKYKATRVPGEIKNLLDNESDLSDREVNGAQLSSNDSQIDLSMQ